MSKINSVSEKEFLKRKVIYCPYCGNRLRIENTKGGKLNTTCESCGRISCMMYRDGRRGGKITEINIYKAC